MLLSASRRTDIPMWYGPWLVNRLRAGFAVVPNPYSGALSRIDLSPDVVDCIVLWTKDPASMLNLFPQIDSMGYPYCIQFTLTPYGRDVEPGLRDKEQIADTFVHLSRLIGPHRMLWRYDPILIGGGMTADWHREQFAYWCMRLHGYTRHVTISFADDYNQGRNPLTHPVEEKDRQGLVQFFGDTAVAFGLDIRTCCEADDLSRWGIRKGACIDREIIEEIFWGVSKFGQRSPSTGALPVRSECGDRCL